MVSGSKGQRVPAGLDLLPECRWLPFRAQPRAADVAPLAGLPCPVPAPSPTSCLPLSSPRGLPAPHSLESPWLLAHAHSFGSHTLSEHTWAPVPAHAPTRFGTWVPLYLAMPSPNTALTTPLMARVSPPYKPLSRSHPTFLSPPSPRRRQEKGGARDESLPVHSSSG